jgi:hypothetical protein
MVSGLTSLGLSFYVAGKPRRNLPESFFNPACDRLGGDGGCLMYRAWIEQRTRRLNPAGFPSVSKLTIRESFD